MANKLYKTKGLVDKEQKIQLLLKSPLFGSEITKCKHKFCKY